jgi:uncharacterized protein YkwD
LRSLLSLCAAVTLLLVCSASAAARGVEARGVQWELEKRVIRLINTVRAQHGAPALVACARLSRAARTHSAELVRRGLLDHSSWDGTPMDTRVRRFLPARGVGETLALVRSTHGAAERVVELWLASAGHRRVMLDASFRRLGVGGRAGFLGGAAGLVFTADFATA